jgi:uncharacterized protein (TIRG00374 family)
MKSRFDLKFWLGIGVSCFFMILLFRKIDFRQLADALKTMNFRYLLPAVLFTFLSYFLRAVRWKYLLQPEKNILLSSLYPATIIGYMANNLLPARLGEFVRAYTLAEKEGLATPAVFASLVIDRLFDGFTVILMLLVTLLTLTFPPGLQDAEAAVKLGGILTFVLYCVVILFLVVFKRHPARTLSLIAVLLKPFPTRFSERSIPLLGSFIGGIRMSSRSSHTCAIIVSSLLVWAFVVLPVDLVLQAFSIHLPIAASMFIVVLLVFAVMVPASPGYIGTYHYACYKGLSAFAIPESTAVSIALVLHALGFFPVTLAGFYYLWRNRIDLNSIAVSGDNQ